MLPARRWRDVRLLAFADVQGNPWAAAALVQAARRLGDCDVYALGNAVGAGPDPSGTLATLRKAGVHLVLGPRDRAAMAKPPREDLRDEGEANLARLQPADLAYLRNGGPPRRLVSHGLPILLTSDPLPDPGNARLVLHPGPLPFVEERRGVTYACTGRADDPAGEAPHVVVDLETGQATLRHAAWTAPTPRRGSP